MRMCIEHGIDPKSEEAPRSIDEALECFFPEYKNWDLSQVRRQQAERLQILADGPTRETSLIIYDDGEGQRPEAFKDTFLSLHRGNKTDIHFVQGKYNMGGTGALVFCGKHRFQLIGSRRFEGDEPFGFTLVRRHPLTAAEEKKKKATWYEYLIIDSEIPSFHAATNMDLGLYKRRFTTGSIIKLYSYALPPGTRSDIARDLNPSINEYLFNPALPVFIVEKKERSKSKYLERALYGLKRRLEEEDSRYVDEYFSEDFNDEDMGRLRITCYVFKPRVGEWSVEETRKNIKREFFKDDMSVLFSLNGQVHGHYTREFITRSLKFNILKDYLLIHIDCTDARTQFRNELFMASRDRLKRGEESGMLRKKMVDILVKGRLKEIYKARKASITVESNDAEKLVRDLGRHLPFRKELVDLFNQTFKLDNGRNGQKKEETNKTKRKKSDEKSAFSSERYPTFFKIDLKPKPGEEIPMVGLPLGGERTIRFLTDVEDQYFDRSHDPGELQIGLLKLASNETNGGDRPGVPREIETLLNVVKSSPRKGKIHVHMKPTQDMKVGDAIRLQASLTSPGKQLDQVFLVKIAEPEKKPKEPKKKEQPDTQLGLPQPFRVYKDKTRGGITWDELEARGISMNHNIVVHLDAEGDALSTVYINMDSHVLFSHRAKLSAEEAIKLAENRYFSAVYYHTLFLYTITKNRKYGIVQQEAGNGGEEVENIEVTEYISDLFKTYYAQFLLGFDTQELISALED